MIIVILILNIIMLLAILAIHRASDELINRFADLQIEVSEIKEKIDDLFPDKETNEYDV